MEGVGLGVQGWIRLSPRTKDPLRASSGDQVSTQDPACSHPTFWVAALADKS